MRDSVETTPDCAPSCIEQVCSLKDMVAYNEKNLAECQQNLDKQRRDLAAMLESPNYVDPAAKALAARGFKRENRHARK